MSMLSHLYPTRVQLTRLQIVMQDGMTGNVWQEVCKFDCRLDLVFRRPGRDDAAYAIEAGRKPDRMGVLLCDYGDLRALDRIACISGPVHGVFEVSLVPDEVPDLTAIHHLEVSVREVSQSLTGSILG